MNNRLKLTEIIAQILKDNPNQSFTAKEVTENIFKEFPDWCENKRKRSKQDLSDDLKFISHLKAKIISKVTDLQKRDSNYQILEEKPRKFIYSTENIKTNTNKSGRVRLKTKLEGLTEEQQMLYLMFTELISIGFPPSYFENYPNRLTKHIEDPKVSADQKREAKEFIEKVYNTIMLDDDLKEKLQRNAVCFGFLNTLGFDWGDPNIELEAEDDNLKEKLRRNAVCFDFFKTLGVDLGDPNIELENEEN